MDARALAEQHAPILVFSKDRDGKPENFYPMDAEAYIRASALYRPGQKNVIPRGQVDPERLASLGPEETRDLYLTFASENLMKGLPPDTARRVPLWQVLYEGWQRFLTGVDPRTPAPVPVVAEGTGEVRSELVRPTWPIRLLALADTALDLWDNVYDSMVERLIGAAMPVLHFVAPQPLLESTWREALRRYAPFDLRREDAPPPVLYYCLEEADPFLVLHYWFFYAYNDWATGHGGHNDHEGDWESIYLLLDPDPPHAVRWVAYAAHEGANLERATGPDVEWCDGHPVAYVGCGSHASYFWPDVYMEYDRAAGDAGVAVTPGDVDAYEWPRLREQVRPRQRRVWHLKDLRQALWAWAYTGFWGTRFRYRWLGKSFHEAHGINGPGGPVWEAGTGRKRPQWEDPLSWLGFRRRPWEFWKPLPE